LSSIFLQNDKLQLFQSDMSKAEVRKQIIPLINLKNEQVSHLFDCVGVIKPGFVRDFMLSDIDCPLDIKTKGSILGIKTLADLMKNQGFGHVTKISSLAGLAPASDPRFIAHRI
jgi:3-oxoacyl-[acyl-carrier protein] reductase